MRKIAVIGTGHAGLLTAHGLLKAGHAVTLYSERPTEQWLTASRPTGTAARFDLSLSYERELGLNFWEKEALPFEGVYLVFCMTPTVPFITLSGRFEKPGYAYDVRLQSYRWTQEFEARGGRLCIDKVNLAQLELIAAENDLVIVASGRGELAELFPRDASRSVYDQPQRNLAMVITKNAPLNFDQPAYRPVRFNFIAEHGEAFWIPYYHKDHGATWNLLFEAKTGGKMDKFGAAQSGEEVLTIAKQTIGELFPWDRDWAQNMELADPNGWLVGKFAPTIRHPVGKLASGRVVTCVGDTVMSFDPIAGQGANNGSKMARHLVNAVAARGDRPFDEAWMETTFEQFYADEGSAAYKFTNLLLEPITDAGKELLIAQYGSAGRSNPGKQAVADAFVANFNDPRFLTETFTDVQQARDFITRTTGKSWVWSAVGGRAAIIRDQVRQKLGFTPAAGYW
ncbi:MAG: oxidoreductase [Anaerolineae bacterium]|nr:oxidoreductase [Anaerolineae bacterium]